MKRIAALLFLYMLPVSASCCWTPNVGVGGNGGNFRKGGGADVWVPISQNGTSVLFAQGGGGYFRDQGIGTIGLGVRSLCGTNFAVGANVFGDVARSEFRSVYPQIGAGLEIFGRCFRLTWNGYLPYTHSHRAGRPFLRIIAEPVGVDMLDFIFNDTPFERAFPGFDLEGSVFIPGCLGTLWGYGGYFFYKWSGVRARQGPRFRLEYRLDRGWPNQKVEINFGARYEHDFLHGHTVSGYGEARFYFGKTKPACLSPLCRQLGRPVYRNKSVWVDPFIREQFVGEELVGLLIFVNNSNDGIGTQTDPATLPNALAAWQPEGVLFFLQDTGDITTATPITALTDGQMLGFGNQTSRTITFPNGTMFTVNDLTGAGRAVIDSSATDVIESADGLFICGIELTGGDVQVSQTGGDAVRIEDVIFSGYTTSAIDNTGGGQLTVLNSTIDGGVSGIAATSPTSSIAVTGTSIGATSAPTIGIDLDSALTTTIASTTITAGTTGLESTTAAGDLTMTGGMITAPTGISHASPSSGMLTVSGVTITPTGVGIDLDTPLVTNIMNTIITAGTTGIDITTPAGDIDVTGGSITSGIGIAQTSPSSGMLTVSGVTITPTGVGIDLDTPLVTNIMNTIITAGTTGIDITTPAGDIDVTGGSITSGTGINYDTPSAGELTVDGATIVATGDGIALTDFVTATVQNGSISGTNGITSSDTLGFTTPKTLRVLPSLTITASSQGIDIDSTEGPLTAEIRGITINGVGGAGDGIVGVTRAAATASNVTIEQNTIQDQTQGVLWTCDANTNLEIDSNTFNRITAVSVRVTKQAAVGVASNVTISNNREFFATSPNAYFLRTNSGGATTVGCGTISGNNRSPSFASDIIVTDWDGTAPNTLFDFSTGATSLMATNNGLTVVINPVAPSSAAACPLPP